MSCTSMLSVPRSGELVTLEEFRNAWGSAWRVWDSLHAKYCGGPFPIIGGDTNTFWRLVDDPRLSNCERLTLAFTYDKMICEASEATKLASALREFDKLLPAKPGNVNHLGAIAAALEAHGAEDCIGFAFIQTSVSGDAWHVSDKCTDSFHETGSEGEYCPTCGSDKDDPALYRLFDWSLDSERGEHFLLFETYGKAVAP